MVKDTNAYSGANNEIYDILKVSESSYKKTISSKRWWQLFN